MVHPPMKFHIFPNAQIHIHAGLLKHHANLLLGSKRLSHHVITSHHNFALRGLSQRRQHANRGGFSCPIIACNQRAVWVDVGGV